MYEFKYEWMYMFLKQMYIIFGKYGMYMFFKTNVYFLNKMSISEKRFIKPSFRENLVFVLK